MSVIIEFIREKVLRKTLQKHWHFAYFISQIAYRFAWTQYNCWRFRKIGLQRDLTSLPIPQNASEKTLFVLGSGASINTYSASQWDEVRENLSIGINYWILHDFVPQYYMTELCADWKDMLHAITLRESELQNASWIIKGNYVCYENFAAIKDGVCRLPESIRKRWYIACDFPIPGDQVKTFRKSLQWMDWAGFFEKDKARGYVAQTRGTITTAIILGIKMGIKKIVLCGVDLNNTRYFFDENPARYEAKGLRIPDRHRPFPRHETEMSFGKHLRISETIEHMQDVICSKRGIQIFVGSKTSALYPQIPLYDWAKAMRKDESQCEKKDQL